MRAVGTAGIGHMKLSDATPIGINVRSTVTTTYGEDGTLDVMKAVWSSIRDDT